MAAGPARVGPAAALQAAEASRTAWLSAIVFTARVPAAVPSVCQTVVANGLVRSRAASRAAEVAAVRE